MSDIFVSYAHQDRDWVARFAESLHKAGGFDIWWDHNILPGEQFDDAIQSAMDGTCCVVVVWSKASVVSRWVKTEAREAARRNILVPVSIEGVTPPLEFRSFETADLSVWRSEPDHENFRELTEALRARSPRTPARDMNSESTRQQTERPLPARREQGADGPTRLAARSRASC
jgi:adenylate cyclase